MQLACNGLLEGTIDNEMWVLTESVIEVLSLALAATYDVLDYEVDVTHYDERWRQDGLGLKLYHKVIPQELPHLVGDRINLVERVAER